MRTEFERVTPESVGIPSEAVEWLLDQLESGFTEPHGLMIMRHGRICAEGWWSPFAPGIRHGLQSHSKTYAATAVGIACTEGLLRLDERIIDIFPEDAPEEPSENLRLLTVRDVLCMGCGMDSMPKTTEHWIRDFLAIPVKHRPGTTFMYNSVGSTLLCAIVRKKTGTGVHEYLKTRLYDKIGIVGGNHKWYTMPDGCESGGGGLFATTEDNLRLMKLYADGGVWNGERILSEEYVKLAVSCQNDSSTESIGNPEASDNFLGYGFQIWMCRPKGVYRADGAMGQFTIVVPDRDMIIAVTENASGAHWAQKTLDTLWEFLDRIPEGENRLDEAPERSAALRERTRRLALPAPVFAPFSPEARRISGKTYRVRTETGRMYISTEHSMSVFSGKPESTGPQEFSLTFAADSVLFSFEDSGVKTEIIAGLDGSRRWNHVDTYTVTEVLGSGYWEKENCFVLQLRWIETCGVITLKVLFEGGKAVIDIDSSMLFMKGIAGIEAEPLE